MARFRDALPQLAPEVFLTDTGLETTLIFMTATTFPFRSHYPAARRSGPGAS